MLSARGAGIVDADVISHELTQRGGAAIEPLRARFGADAISADGSLDRDRMRERAFSDVDARKQLEALLHPMIRTAMRERAAALSAASHSYLVFVIPLLVESGASRNYIDRLLLVDCSETTQIARVCARSAIGEDAARAIIAAQASRQQRLAAANDVLFNEALLNDIEPKVERLHRLYLRFAAQH